jgi:probable HAF family extracellular repeat protein
MTVPATLHRAILLGLTLGAASINGCGGGGGADPITTAPPIPLTVSSVSPTSSFQDVTIDVRVLGSGFEPRARAVWALGADTSFATTGIRTNSTTFVGASELLANISIRPDAPAASFSVLVVSAAGRGSTGNVPFDVKLHLNLQVELVDLGAGDNSVARGINNAGKVVGSRGADPTSQQAFLWENGVITNLGVLPGMKFSWAFDINEGGQVVGVSGTGTIDNPIIERAFIWTAVTGMQALSTLGGALASARAVNDSGDIAGFATLPGTGLGHAVVWRKGVISDLQSASFGQFEGRAFAINNPGEAVGYVYGQSGFRSTASVPLTLISGAALLFGINTTGCIASWAATSAQGYRTCAGVTRNVGNCGGSGTRAWAINSAGLVVGDAANAAPGGAQGQAYIWTEGGITCFPLPQGSNGSVAYAINDNGWIAGDVSRPVGGNRATLWKVK